MNVDNNKVSTNWKIPSDAFLKQIRQDWFDNQQKRYSQSFAIQYLNDWFQSTKINNLVGWESLGCIDITMGCAHYIESFMIGQHSIDNWQVLPYEYAYYQFMGKWGTEPGNLEINKPLIITLPHYRWGDIRPEWPDVLRECEQKNIDIHIDMAWLTLSSGINIDFSHPNIKSVGMSMSKYDLQWNRVGLRYSKQRKLDSITVFNHFYQNQVNENLYSCAVFCAERIPRDYAWTVYGDRNQEICQTLDFQQTRLVHGVKKDQQVYCITDLLSPHSK